MLINLIKYLFTAIFLVLIVSFESVIGLPLLYLLSSLFLLKQANQWYERFLYGLFFSYWLAIAYHLPFAFCFMLIILSFFIYSFGEKILATKAWRIVTATWLSIVILSIKINYQYNWLLLIYIIISITYIVWEYKFHSSKKIHQYTLSERLLS